MTIGNLFTTRRKHLLIGAGIGLCILAAPAGVAANGTQRSGPSHAPTAQQILTPSATNHGGTPPTTGSGSNQQPSSSGHSGGTLDSCGYDPTVAPVFGEDDVMEGATIVTTPSASGTATRIAAFGADEKGIYWPASGTDAQGRPENPSVFVTDITSNPSSRSGDWQNGGTGNSSPDGVFGYTTNTIGVTATLKSAIPDPFSFTFAGGKLNAEAVWLASSISSLTPGHTYRFQLMVHDGDQNHTSQGGDVGEACVNLTIPPSPAPPNCYPTKSVSTGDGTPVASGTLLTYTVTLTNNGTAGPCVLNDIDTLLGGATLTNITVNPPTLGSFTPAAPTSIPFQWSIASLGAGQSASFTMTANAIGSAAGAEVDNTATVITGCTATAAHPCTVTVHTPLNPPPAGPECTPNKTANPSGSVPVGAVVTYTVTMTNNGASPGDCALTDVLSATSDTTINVTQLPSPPAGTTMTILNGACTPTQCSELPLTINWSVPGLAPGASKHFTMQVTVTGAGSTNNSISSASLNGTITNTATSTAFCTANCIIIVNNPVTFALTKSVSPTGTLTGPFPETVTYTVTLKNTSANPAVTGVLVDDVLSGTAGFTVDDSSFKGPADMSAVTKVGDGHYQWTIPADDLPAGGAASVTFTAAVSNATNQDTSTTASCIDSVSSGTLCADNVATALGMKVHVQNPLSPAPASSVQAITTTPSTGITNEMNIAVAGFLFLGGLGLVLLGLLAKAPAVAPRRTRS